MRLTAEVHDLAEAERLTTVQVEGTLDSVFSLVDQLSVQVLGSGLVQEGAALLALEIEQAKRARFPP